MRSCHGGMGPDQFGKQLRRSDLEENPLFVNGQGLERWCKTDCLARLTRPVIGVGQLFASCPPAEERGEKRYLRRVKIYGRGNFAVRFNDRVHHPRMISMRDIDHLVGDAPFLQSALKRLHRLVRAGNGGVLRTINLADIQVLSNERAEVLLAERDCHHCPGGQSFERRLEGRSRPRP